MRMYCLHRVYTSTQLFHLRRYFILLKPPEHTLSKPQTPVRLCYFCFQVKSNQNPSSPSKALAFGRIPYSSLIFIQTWRLASLNQADHSLSISSTVWTIRVLSTKTLSVIWVNQPNNLFEQALATFISIYIQSSPEPCALYGQLV